MIKPQDAKKMYQFYDADESEDSIIRQVVYSVQCSKVELGINIGAAVLTAVIAAILINSMIENGIKPTLLIVSIALPGVFIYRAYQTIKKKLDSSGILATKDRSQHYLECRTTCSSKRYENSRYIITCKTHQGKTIDNVLVTHGVYNYLTILENVTVCLPDGDTEAACFGIPSQYFQRFKKNAEDKASITEIKRDLREGEREYITEQYKNRVETRNRLFIGNNVILLAVSIAIAVLGYIKHNAGPLYLGAVASVLLIGSYVTQFIEDKNFYKKISNPDTPIKILEATVSGINEKSNAVSFSLPSSKVPVYTSEKREIRMDFQKGSSALLVYIGEEAPVPFRRFTK